MMYVIILQLQLSAYREGAGAGGIGNIEGGKFIIIMAIIYGEGFSKEIGGVKVKGGTDVGEDKHILGHAVAVLRPHKREKQMRRTL
jgi:hypothetical protein